MKQRFILFAAIISMISLLLCGCAKQQRLKCRDNLKQVGVALAMYADDNKGYMPKSLSSDEFEAYGYPGFSNCPIKNVSYEYNFIPKLYIIKDPNNTIVVRCNCHKGYELVLYADGYVEATTRKK